MWLGLTVTAHVVVFASAMLGGCTRAPALHEPTAAVGSSNTDSAPQGTASASNVRANASASPRIATITNADPAPAALALHVITHTDAYAAQVYPQADRTRVLVPACLVDINGAQVVPGRYPLPGRACREPLRKLMWSGGRQWLLAGVELWSSIAGEEWLLQATMPGAEEVLLPASGAPGLALVVPYRQPSRSVHQVSSSFELRRISGNAWPHLPMPALAKSNPQLSFDDYVGACFTKTRLATPRGFQISATGQVLVFGTECNRDDQSLSSVVETWSAGKRESVIARLPFAKQGALQKVQFIADDEIWAAQAFGLLHFDGSNWAEIPLPEDVKALANFSVSPSGTLWLATLDAQVWQRKRGQPWQRRTTSALSGAVRAVFADNAEDVWVSTDTTLFSTRPLPTGELCASPCDSYWQENSRMGKVPHGD